MNPDPTVQLPALNGHKQTTYITTPADFPQITVTTPASSTAEGLIFLSTFYFDLRNQAPSQPYLLILDNAGEPVFYRKMPVGNPLIDFKPQPDGTLTYADFQNNQIYVLDNTYTLTRTITAKNGFKADNHEVLVLPNGNVLYMIYDARTVDMSQIAPGGLPNATVLGLVLQEQDPAGNIAFEWQSWDHIPITDTNQDLTLPVIDYIHGNSIDVDDDGHLLLSSRHIDEVTKIDHQTGEIIWRLGGKANQFTFLDDSRPFIKQHDARRLDNGNLLLFDNGDGQFGDDPVVTPERYSRAAEYALDEVNMTATLVWEYRHTPDVYTFAMGNAQRLPNGNTLIGWGSTYPTLSEVTPDGAKAFELTLGPGPQPNIPQTSYRAFRFPWQGFPSEPPTLVPKEENGATVLYYSWNGATDVASYQVEAANAPDDGALITTQDKTGFEERTIIANATAQQYCLYRVTPVDTSGAAQPPSSWQMAERCVKQRLYLPLVSVAQ
ncbi:MAG: aryl-sulfate sulfotransferase [Caldilineaceae bacterium]